MLVPAMAFAWCVVSMSAPPPRHAEPISSGSAARSRLPAPALVENIADTEPPSEREGRRVPVKLVTPAIVRVARSFLDLPMGAERSADVEGRHYVFVLERHYHPPGYVGGPIGYHKGVTVYEFR